MFLCGSICTGVCYAARELHQKAFSSMATNNNIGEAEVIMKREEFN